MSENAILKQLAEDIGRNFEALKEANDKRFKEIEQSGAASILTIEEIRKNTEDFVSMKKKIKELETRLNRPTLTFETAHQNAEDTPLHRSFIKFMRYGEGNLGGKLTEEERKAYASMLEKRGLADAEGGFLVPPDFDRSITLLAYDQAAVRPYCQAGRTGRDSVSFMRMKKPTAAWGHSGVSITAQELSAGIGRMAIHDLTAIQVVHQNTLDDSDADIVSEISNAFAEAKAEAEDDAFVVGTGVDQPEGVLVNSTVLANFELSLVAAALSDATYNGVDALTKLQYKIKNTYRTNGIYACNSTTEGLIRVLKDDYGRYHWQPSVNAGRPSTFLGKEIINPEGMPDVAAGAYPVIFGDFGKGYKIRDRKNMTVRRLDELYAGQNMVGFKIHFRVGGYVHQPEAFSVLKIAAS